MLQSRRCDKAAGRCIAVMEELGEIVLPNGLTIDRIKADDFDLAKISLQFEFGKKTWLHKIGDFWSEYILDGKEVFWPSSIFREYHEAKDYIALIKWMRSLPRDSWEDFGESETLMAAQDGSFVLEPRTRYAFLVCKDMGGNLKTAMRCLKLFRDWDRLKDIPQDKRNLANKPLNEY